jgi:hypothetical protein
MDRGSARWHLTLSCSCLSSTEWGQYNLWSLWGTHPVPRSSQDDKVIPRAIEGWTVLWSRAKLSAHSTLSHSNQPEPPPRPVNGSNRSWTEPPTPALPWSTFLRLHQMRQMRVICWKVYSVSNCQYVSPLHHVRSNPTSTVWTQITRDLKSVNNACTWAAHTVNNYDAPPINLQYKFSKANKELSNTAERCRLAAYRRGSIHPVNNC